MEKLYKVCVSWDGHRILYGNVHKEKIKDIRRMYKDKKNVKIVIE